MDSYYFHPTMKKEHLLKWFLLLFVIIAFSCKSHDNAKDNEVYTVIVQMHDSSATAQLEQDHAPYDLKKEKVISRPMQIFLFSFNSGKISNTELVQLLKQSNLVKEAQLNRNVTLRN